MLLSKRGIVVCWAGAVSLAVSEGQTLEFSAWTSCWGGMNNGVAGVEIFMAYTFRYRSPS